MLSHPYMCTCIGRLQLPLLLESLPHRQPDVLHALQPHPRGGLLRAVRHMCKCAHLHMHVRTPTCARVHTCPCACAHLYMHSMLSSHIRRSIQPTHVHTWYAHTYACAHTHTHMQVHPGGDIHIHAYARTHRYTHAGASVQEATYIHMHTHICTRRCVQEANACRSSVKSADGGQLSTNYRLYQSLKKGALSCAASRSCVQTTAGQTPSFCSTAGPQANPNLTLTLTLTQGPKHGL